MGARYASFRTESMNFLAQNLKHESFLKDYCWYCSFSYTQTPFDRHINALNEGGRDQL